ncbi:MAG: hypothetical protein PQ612_08205 [Rickettsiales bacterium]|nr:hypothetical protein [Pseudomonadota bacterium]MDA0966797.1 hypothetical protein [Pseudomonadota bacterium]MDG4543469.1 hypothetical protein [Rickettsiales bacterium]MDG4546137.1 hypothetical protein [Rickettsiales bacterium]MDG4547610.1 hypothetical protein [Rickettsiales bacterium]
MKDLLLPIIKKSTRISSQLSESFIKAFSARAETPYASKGSKSDKKQNYPALKDNHYRNNNNTHGNNALLYTAVGFAGVVIIKGVRENAKKRSTETDKKNDIIPISESNSEALKKYYSERIFTNGIRDEKTNEIMSEFLKVIDSKDDKPLIHDIMQTIAAKGALNKINLSSEPQLIETKTGMNMLTASLDKDNNINVYDADNRTTKEVISSIVHEAAHLLQNITIENNIFLKNPFKSSTLIDTLKKDRKLNKGSKVISELIEDIMEYDSNKYGFEIHSRVMEQYYANTEEAKRLFPNTISEISKIHKNVKSTLYNDPASFVQRLSFSNRQPTAQSL